MKTIVILGMHRSATSLVAKGLANEIYMGDRFLAANKGNPKGYYEDVDFFNLNRLILNKAGGSWDNPPKEEDILQIGRDFATGISLLINTKIEKAKKLKYNIWGWKDPRTVLTIKAFLPYLPNLHIIPVFRDPNGIAKSLNHRGDMDTNKAFNLAKEYHSRMLNFMNEWYEEKYNGSID